MAHIARTEVLEDRVGHVQFGLFFVQQALEQVGQFEQRGAKRGGHVEDIGGAGRGFGQGQGGPDVGLHHIVDEAEVAACLPISVDLHRFFAQQGGRPARNDGGIGAVRILPGTEHVEVAHAGGAHAVAAGIDAGKEFVGGLGGGVGREHVADGVFHLGQAGMVAIHRAGRGVDEGLHAGQAGGVENFHEAGDVGLERGQRRGHRAGHRAQRSLVQHVVDTLDDAGAEVAVTDGAFLEVQAVLAGGPGAGHDGVDVGLLAGREIVDGNHVLAGQCQGFCQVGADEAGRAGHEPARLAPGHQGRNVHGM